MAHPLKCSNCLLYTGYGETQTWSRSLITKLIVDSISVSKCNRLLHVGSQNYRSSPDNKRGILNKTMEFRFLKSVALLNTSPLTSHLSPLHPSPYRTPRQPRSTNMAEKRSSCKILYVTRPECTRIYVFVGYFHFRTLAARITTLSKSMRTVDDVTRKEV